MIILSKSTIKFVYFSDFLQMFSFLILLDIIKKEEKNLIAKDTMEIILEFLKSVFQFQIIIVWYIISLAN